MRIGMSISNYGSKMRYDGIDLINPIDILENENENYEDVIGQFRTESWEMPLIFRLGASVKPIANDNQTLIISTDVLHPKIIASQLTWELNIPCEWLAVIRFS